MKNNGKYIISGGNALFGEVKAQGCKNSALALIFASLLCDGETVLYNIPMISDVDCALDIMRYYGADIEVPEPATVIIRTKNLAYREPPADLTEKMRASGYLLGALLGRFGKCELPQSGGCNFGNRPIDYHINAVKALGAKEEGDFLTTENGLWGGRITFPKKSVGATVNALLAAVKAKGKTTIYNAAKEPHIIDLVNFLNTCGADICGQGTDTITVCGVKKLHGSAYKTDADMIEVGTLLFASLASYGKIRITDAPVHELISVFEVLKQMGAELLVTKNSVTAYSKRLCRATVTTAPYPCFPTDLQPQITALLGISEGKSTVTESVFSSRFAYLNELKKCGLDFKINRDCIEITGIKGYLPAEITATDLRGGAAGVIAALNACGTSVISNTALIERGYENFPKKLSLLGADIQVL